jgi:hypothetical protein
VSDRFYKILVVTERAEPARWQASATVSKDGIGMVGHGDGGGSTEEDAAAEAVRVALKATLKKLEPEARA